MSAPTPPAPLRVVALVSGAGSTLRALLEAIEASRGTAAAVGAELVALGSDTPRANLALADEYGLPSFLVDPRAYPDRDAWGRALLERICEHRPELTLLSGFMRLVPPSVVRALSPRLINQHPAYLPEFPGHRAVRDALASGARQTGASIIVVDEGVDTGPIVERVRVPIEAGDDEESLHERIKTVEREMLVRTVRGIADGSIRLDALVRDEPGGPGSEGGGTA